MEQSEIKCLIPGSETGGAVSVYEEVVAPGAGPPLHTHRDQLEIFHVVSGTILFEIDGERKEVGAGGAASVPAGAVHSFKNVGEEAAVIHFELLPAGNSEEFFEKLVAGEIGDPAVLFDRYGMDLKGPPLEA